MLPTLELETISEEDAVVEKNDEHQLAYSSSPIQAFSSLVNPLVILLIIDEPTTGSASHSVC
jgi:hypothetical protein